MKNLTKILIGLTCLFAYAQAAVLTFQTNDNGWYTSTGNHGTTNTNTFTGFYSTFEYRSFYNFDLGSLGGEQVIAAEFKLHAGNGTYNSPDSSEIIEIWDVTTTPGLGSSVPVFNDLGTGVQYGSTLVTSSQGSSMPEIIVNLNANSFADIADGGAFSLGARLGTLSMTGTEGFYWGSNGVPSATLTITTAPVPEPSTYALLALGLLGLGAYRKKSKK